MNAITCSILLAGGLLTVNYNYEGMIVATVTRDLVAGTPAITRVNKRTPRHALSPLAKCLEFGHCDRIVESAIS